MRRLAALMVTLMALLSACAAPVAGTPSPTASPITLDGTSWVVTQIKGAATVAEKQPTMAFADGKVGGNASCNNYSGGYTQQGGTLTIGPVAQTAMACADDTLTKQEAAFTGALGEVKQVRAAGTGAELLDTAGSPVLTLAPAPKVTPKPLVGTAWTLSGIVANQAVTSPVADTTVTMTLTDDSVSGKACNRFRGPVKIDGENLTVGPLASTKMACESEAESKQEATVLAILDEVTSYTIEADTLTLTAPDDKGLTFTAK